MKRSPLKRKKGVNAISKRKRLQQNDEREVRKGFLEAHPYCMLQREGYPHECFGGLSVHEVWTRARGGPTGDERNLKVVCFEGNRRVSQDPHTMQWAKENGWLVSASQGAEWLESQTHRCQTPKCPFISAGQTDG